MTDLGVNLPSLIVYLINVAMLLFMVLFGLLFLGLLVLLGLWLFRQLQGQPPGRAGESNALRILQDRYARGEISREEYEKSRADLEAR